jgi:ATP-dependent Lhr-like helicase
MQRKRAADLLSVAARHPTFPIVLEAYRECLQDVFDLPALVDLARQVRRREIRLVTVDTQSPSPFSASLLFGYVANYLYDGDAPLAERRAQALSVDQGQLRELMGEAELRELLDLGALHELEESLQGLLPHQRLRSADRLHDLLLRVGDLSLAEISARVEVAAPGKGAAPAESEAAEETVEAPRETVEAAADREAVAQAWVGALLSERRVIAVGIGGEERVAAAEDAARLRDALGVPPPPGLPQAFLEPVPHALRDLVARYARTHGPFHAVDVARRLGCGTAPVESALQELLADGRVVLGEFRPGGSGREWVSPDVLTSLRQRSLAKLRREIAPAEPLALARTLCDWQGIAVGSTPRPSGPDALLDVIEQLQGAAVPASDLERSIFPARLPGYRPADLDALCAAGEVVWVGRAPLGDRDGRLSLYLADDLWLLHETSTDRPQGDLHDRLRAHLREKGASFFADLRAAAGGGLERPVLDALWDLVWSGEVTNDTPAALRAFLRPPARHRAPDERQAPRLAAFRSRRQAAPSSAGRWSLLQPPPGTTPPTPTERLLARAEQLLARHGILTRDAVAAEDVPGGFAALYPVLRTLEEAGRIRRGYFVRGLGGSQFAHPGALERLRALRDPAEAGDDETRAGVVLCADDPANPYGATLPWPPAEGARPMRAAGTHVVLVEGALAAFLGRAEKELRTFVPAEEPSRSRVLRALALALADWARRSGHARSLGWAASDAQPMVASPLAPFLLEAGFVRFGPGFRYAGPSFPALTESEGSAVHPETDPSGRADDED